MSSLEGLSRRLAAAETVLAVRRQPPPRRPVGVTVASRAEIIATDDAERLVMAGHAWLDWGAIADELQPLQAGGFATTAKAYLSCVRYGQPPKMHGSVHGRSRSKSQNA